MEPIDGWLAEAGVSSAEDVAGERIYRRKVGREAQPERRDPTVEFAFGTDTVPPLMHSSGVGGIYGTPTRVGGRIS